MGRVGQVHRHASGAQGIFANAYLVETTHGVVAVDALLTESDSKALRAKVISLRKPLRAVLITHGHPDHYNGVTNLVGADGVPVVATDGVNRVIRENDAARSASGSRCSVTSGRADARFRLGSSGTARR